MRIQERLIDIDNGWGGGIADFVLLHLRRARNTFLRASSFSPNPSATLLLSWFGSPHPNSKIAHEYKYSGAILLAGMEGFEPPNARTKTWCLTTWPHPIDNRNRDKPTVFLYCAGDE
jgi:hypothetical protein